MLEWSNEKVINLLELLQTEPCLWDPSDIGFKNRSTQYKAWTRIQESLPFQASIEDMKRKKESLMCYYRTHLNRFKKCLKSGNGEVYTCTWFAFKTMDSFLRRVYSNPTLNTEDNKSKDAQESYAVEEEMGHNLEEQDIKYPIETKSPQDPSRKRQLKDDLPLEIRVARRKMDEAFKYIKEKSDDEFHSFGTLISIQVKTIQNQSIRDKLMNDIHNLVLCARMRDRLEQSFPAESFNQVFIPSQKTSRSPSPHHQE